ncbi:CinA family protein [Parafrankia elaeagni]|uniref:CinA family protein n=1 Tax=Parafrankia elaeagni TaxID=222534 RepID=UPI00036EE3D8|nr:CinA family protein [Parafrankia elaeagni]
MIPGPDPDHCRRQWADALRLADLVHGRLVTLGRTVSVAESLTGGLISALLTEAPGTSTTFRGGLVVYATDLKNTAAGVDRGDLDRHGPVRPLRPPRRSRPGCSRPGCQGALTDEPASHEVAMR